MEREKKVLIGHYFYYIMQYIHTLEIELYQIDNTLSLHYRIITPHNSHNSHPRMLVIVSEQLPITENFIWLRVIKNLSFLSIFRRKTMIND